MNLHQSSTDSNQNFNRNPFFSCFILMESKEKRHEPRIPDTLLHEKILVFLFSLDSKRFFFKFRNQSIFGKFAHRSMFEQKINQIINTYTNQTSNNKRILTKYTPNQSQVNKIQKRSKYIYLLSVMQNPVSISLILAADTLIPAILSRFRTNSDDGGRINPTDLEGGGILGFGQFFPHC